MKKMPNMQKQLKRPQLKILEWVEKEYGSINECLKLHMIPELYHETIVRAVKLRCEFSILLSPSEEYEFQQRAMEIYINSPILPPDIAPAHGMVLEITRLWIDNRMQSN